MGIFEETPNGIVQHGPCPYCGEWNCSHNDSAVSKPVADIFPEEERRQEPKTLLVPGWPYRERNRKQRVSATKGSFYDN